MQTVGCKKRRYVNSVVVALAMPIMSEDSSTTVSIPEDKSLLPLARTQTELSPTL
jgi:hypothetical protein